MKVFFCCQTAKNENKRFMPRPPNTKGPRLKNVRRFSAAIS